MPEHSPQSPNAGPDRVTEAQVLDGVDNVWADTAMLAPAPVLAIGTPPRLEGRGR